MIDVIISAEVSSLPWKYVNMDMLQKLKQNQAHKWMLIISFWSKQTDIFQDVFTGIPLLNSDSHGIQFFAVESSEPVL